MKTIYDIIKSRGCYGIRCKRGWCPIYHVCMNTIRDISMSDVSVPNGRTTDKFTDEHYDVLIKKLLKENIITGEELFEVLL